MEAYLVAIAIVTLIYALMALGLTLQFGLSGLINFGLAGFFAVGAYVSALLAVAGLPIFASLAVGTVMAAVVSIPLGMISLRLRDDYFAIVTLGFSETVRIAASSEVWLTNGVRGLGGVPRLFDGVQPAGLSQAWILALVMLIVVVATWIIHRVARSPFGRIIEAIRDNETAVASLGKDPARFKVQVFVAGSAIVGLAGGLYAHYIGFVAPDQFLPIVTFYVWMAIVLGGVGRVSGAIVGTLVLMTLLEGSRFFRDVIPFVSEVEMASLRLGAVGLALVLLMIYRPTGLMGDFTVRRK